MYLGVNYFSSFEEISGAHSIGAKDEPLISERDKREFMSLTRENISMDFILEMREAFQLFDKVRHANNNVILQLSDNVTISSTFYARLFHTKVFLAAFL